MSARKLVHISVSNFGPYEGAATKG